jgi:prepilin-type N-terminal cleavage/methylation domain-containing protein
MRMASKRRSRKTGSGRGFTLIEILVALAIAAGAFILIVSAATASVRRGELARLKSRLERRCESKLSEWMCRAEKKSGGALTDFDGHLWEVKDAPETSASIRGLRRVTFTVRGPGGARVLEWDVLVHREERPR